MSDQKGDDQRRDNPHMWVPNRVHKPYDEVCDLCGVFSGAHNREPDPTAAMLPCPETWPASSFTDEDLAALETETELQDSADGNGALYHDRRGD